MFKILEHYTFLMYDVRSVMFEIEIDFIQQLIQSQLGVCLFYKETNIYIIGIF